MTLVREDYYAKRLIQKCVSDLFKVSENAYCPLLVRLGELEIGDTLTIKIAKELGIPFITEIREIHNDNDSITKIEEQKIGNLDLEIAIADF